jgi:chaperone required for assembly of F1-ATPase
MDNRLLNQFNNLYTITNNPSDVIPYKYFTNSFNGIQLHKIDILLEKLNLYKSTVNYINTDNNIINRVINNQYLLNKNNTYHKQFIDNYNNKDKFKLISIVGIIEKINNTNINTNINNNSSQNNTTTNEQIIIIDNIINQMQNNIILLQTLKNNINNENDNISEIDLGILIENTIKHKSISN